MQEIRISPSQINLFLNEPAVWVLNKFYKVYGDMGSAAKRGNAVEQGLNAILLNDQAYEKAVAWAHDVYDRDIEDAGIDDGKVEEEKSIVAPMIEQACNLFLDLGMPLKTQIRIEGKIDGLEVLGIADYEYDDFMIDLKSTKRCPSSEETISIEHIRQVAYYRLVTGKTQKLAYVTPKKGIILEPTKDQLDFAEKQLITAAKAMSAAYEMEDDNGVESLVTLYPPRDTNSFYWDKKTLDKAYEIWYS